MKTLLSVLLALFVVAFAAPSFAAGSGGVAFPLFSSASAAVKTSSAYNVRGYRTKTMQVSGATLGSNASAITFKNMSGTVIAECSATGSDPWATCVQQDSTAVSLTSNGLLSWDDAVSYVRLKWTGGTVGGKLKAFFNWAEN